jgi:hypothetical protein
VAARAKFPGRAVAAASVAKGRGMGLWHALRRWLVAATVDLIRVQIRRSVGPGQSVAGRGVGDGRLEVLC